MEALALPVELSFMPKLYFLGLLHNFILQDFNKKSAVVPRDTELFLTYQVPSYNHESEKLLTYINISSQIDRWYRHCVQKSKIYRDDEILSCFNEKTLI